MSRIPLLCLPLVLLNGCFPFMGQIEKDAAAFRSAHPNGFSSLQAQGHSIHYAVTGPVGAPLLLLIHGSPGDWTAFAAYMNDSALNTKFRIVVPDRLGYGGSERGKPEPSLKMQAAMIAEVLRAQSQRPRAIVLGHSLGGPVAARMAMDYPELVKGLVLAAPSIDPAMEHITWDQHVADWPVIRWMLPTDLVTCNQEIIPLKPELEIMLPLWKSVACPVRMIQGMKDDLVPPENADFAERMLTKEQLRVTRVPGLNHFIPWARPDLLKQAILELNSF